MLLLAVICALGGVGLVMSGMTRGELNDELPSDPRPHRRTVIGAMVFVGGTLIMVGMLAVARLTTLPQTANVDQPVESSGFVEPVSTTPAPFR